MNRSTIVRVCKISIIVSTIWRWNFPRNISGRIIISLGNLYPAILRLLLFNGVPGRCCCFVAEQERWIENRRMGAVLSEQAEFQQEDENSGVYAGRLPNLDVSFPPTGRKFPFPYGGVCLLLAAGQSGQTRGKEEKKENARGSVMRPNDNARKNNRLKEFKYTLEIKTAARERASLCSILFLAFPGERGKWKQRKRENRDSTFVAVNRFLPNGKPVSLLACDVTDLMVFPFF